MTFKEWMIKNNPEDINDNWQGGVFSCPYYHGLESKSESRKNCEPYGGKGCEYCWNREMLELSNQNGVFIKSDLKNGMIVEYRNGEKRIVVDDHLLGMDSWSMLENFEDNLTHCCNSEYDIYSVYNAGKFFNLKEILEMGYGLEEIWRRKDPVKFTVKEAEEKLKELLGGRSKD